MGFFDTPNTPGVQPNMLTPEMIQMLMDEYGIDAETFLGGGMWKEQPSLTVQDTMKPMPEVAPDPTPEVAPQVGVNPENNPSVGTRDSWYAKLLGGLGDKLGGDSAAGQALMATGLGILGSQNTYGSTMGALGQGGIAGMATYNAQKRDQEVRQLARQKLAQELDAARLKKVENKINFMQKLLDNGQTEDANKIMSDPDVREYLKGMGTGVVWKGKQEKPVIHFNDSTGEVLRADPLTGETALAGKYTPTPREPRDPLSGAYDKEWVNTPGMPNYQPNLPVGTPLTARLDRAGNILPNSIGVAQSRGFGLRVDKDGTIELATDGAKVPPKVQNDADKSIQRADEIISMADRLDRVLNQSNVGVVGKARSLFQGSVAQLWGVSSFAAEATGIIDAAQRDAANTVFEKEFNNKDLNDTQRLSLALSFLYARSLAGPGQLTEKELASGKEFVGNNGLLTSAASMRDALRIIRDTAVAQRESGLARLRAKSMDDIPGVRQDTAGGQGAPPTPSPSPNGAPPSGNPSNSAYGATPSGMSRDKQNEAKNLIAKLSRATNPITGKTYSDEEIKLALKAAGL